MKSKCKPIVLSKKDKIKNIVLGLIICYLLVLFFICTLIRDYSETHLSDDIVWIILLFIVVTIITIVFIRDFKSIFSFPDWKLAIDQAGVYSKDKDGEFRVEWTYIKKIIFVYWKGRIFSMDVITSIGKHKKIDLSLIELYTSPVKKAISTFSRGECEMVFVKTYDEYGKNKALFKGDIVHNKKTRKGKSHS